MGQKIETFQDDDDNDVLRLRLIGWNAFKDRDGMRGQIAGLFEAEDLVNKETGHFVYLYDWYKRDVTRDEILSDNPKLKQVCQKVWPCESPSCYGFFDPHQKETSHRVTVDKRYKDCTHTVWGGE